MNLFNLNEQELLELQVKIESRLTAINKDKLDEINRKNSGKNKTKLSELIENDIILGIRFALNYADEEGEYLETLGTRWEVNLVDYCNIEAYVDKKYTNDKCNRIRIKHRNQTFGITASITDEEADKPYLLHINSSPTGYCGFFTLLPETWEADISIALADILKERKRYFDTDIDKLSEKVNMVLHNKDMINQEIKLLQS